MPDRLSELVGCRAVLQHNRIDSIDAYRGATSDQLAGHHKHGGALRRLVDQDAPAVLAVAQADPLHGAVISITHGDTITVELAGGTCERVRLTGIDPPETKHRGCPSNALVLRRRPGQRS